MNVVIAVIIILGVLSLGGGAPEKRTMYTASNPSPITTRVDSVGTPRLTCTDQVPRHRDLTLAYASQGNDVGTATGECRDD